MARAEEFDLRQAAFPIPWPPPEPLDLAASVVLPDGESLVGVAVAAVHACLIETSRGYRVIEPDPMGHPTIGPLWTP